MASLGELERSIMERLWSAPSDLSAPELREELRDGELALTTVYTVLTRLELKGFVDHDEGRPRRYRASAGRAEHAASVIREVLANSSDRVAVLTRFVGTVSREDAHLLRRLLRTHPEVLSTDRN
jgi:predicted transcriptional regulator